MSVFTTVTPDDLQHWLRDYAVGELQSASCMNCAALLRASKTPTISSPPEMAVTC